MMRAAHLALLLLMLSACSSSPLWFESDYWFGDPKQTSSEQPSYIPIAAVPPRPDIDWGVKKQGKSKKSQGNPENQSLEEPHEEVNGEK